MKVIAVNSSPKMDKGNTAVILTPFLEGMQQAGAEVEVLYTRKLNVKPCEGCFNCWVKTPGVCIHKDDMPAILPKIHGADIWVLATPLYVDGMTGPMKNMLDRIIPGALPFFEQRDGHNRHPGRSGTKGGKIVLVSNCGFWELDNFDALVTHIEAISRNTGRVFAGALLRPHAGGLKTMSARGHILDDVLLAAKQSGQQLIRDGEITRETLNRVSQEVMSRENYTNIVNKSFKAQLESNQ